MWPLELEALESVFADEPEDSLIYGRAYGALETAGYVKRDEGTYAGYTVTEKGRLALVKDRLMR